MKNKERFLIVFCIFFFAFSIVAFAHGGRTDSSGGHHDYNNVSGLGSYHYHHGYSAHLHENGICPYSSSNNSDTFYTVEPPPKPVSSNRTTTSYVQKDTPLENNAPESPFTTGIIIFSTLSLVAFRYFLKYLDHRLHPPDPIIPNHTEVKNTYITQNNVFISPSTISQIIPPQYTIGKSGLPADIDAPRHWGKTFTVYLNQSTNTYHRGRCRHVSPCNCRPVHVLQLNNKCKPCKICNPQIPNMDWYKEYLHQKQMLQIRENYSETNK